ncbi:MAG: RES family NAD+ phosphorylase [Trichloromonas sp.]|jgi:RES domain-containing protein|nr:RES family NAD+ phosphorylase [Trichloromonas sp.]
MRVYRIARAEFAEDLTGKGAALRGGRWNRRGIPMIYSAKSTALATLEVRINIDIDLPELSRVVMEIPDHLVPAAAPVYLPEPNDSRKYGSAWATDPVTLCLKVFSPVLPNADDSFNVLINPAHPNIDQVRIVDISTFEFDSRLF